MFFFLWINLPQTSSELLWIPTLKLLEHGILWALKCSCGRKFELIVKKTYYYMSRSCSPYFLILSFCLNKKKEKRERERRELWHRPRRSSAAHVNSLSCWGDWAKFVLAVIPLKSLKLLMGMNVAFYHLWLCMP